MVFKYKEKWQDQLEVTHPELKPKFQESRRNRQTELKIFGRSSDNLLDYSYFNTLFFIISLEWSVFEKNLKKDMDYWNSRKDAIVKIRNPLAHFRDEIPSESKKIIAEGYCKEIIDIVHQEKHENGF
jgi:hypothetical protein